MWIFCGGSNSVLLGIKPQARHGCRQVEHMDKDVLAVPAALLLSRLEPPEAQVPPRLSWYMWPAPALRVHAWMSGRVCLPPWSRCVCSRQFIP